jgi:hypothetical protein
MFFGIFSLGLIPPTFQIFMVVSFEHEITICLFQKMITHLLGLIEDYLIDPVGVLIKVRYQRCLLYAQCFYALPVW